MAICNLFGFPRENVYRKSFLSSGSNKTEALAPASLTYSFSSPACMRNEQKKVFFQKATMLAADSYVTVMLFSKGLLSFFLEL